jgi:hypothetical protein
MGIGLSNPAFKLEVAGDVNASNFREVGTLLTTKYTLSNTFAAYSNYLGSNFFGCNMSLSNMFLSSTLGVGVQNPIAPVQLSNDPGTVRQMVLFSLSNNDHEYFGTGIGVSNSSNYVRYQACYGDHLFSASRTATTSYDLMRLGFSGRVDITSNALYVANKQVVFGRDYNFLEFLTARTTTVTTYSNVISSNITVEGGTYFLKLYGELRSGTAARWAQYAVFIDNAATPLFEPVGYITNVNQAFPINAFKSFTLTSGSHLFDVRFRRATTSGAATITASNTRCVFWRAL